jgi:hypothetical protein
VTAAITTATSVPMVKTRRTGYGTTEVQFMDPMTARKLGTSLTPQDEIVDLSAWQSAHIAIRQGLLAVPKAIARGLSGSSQYSQADFNVLTQIPYYLGGAFLTLSYLVGKDKLSTWQQGLGVLGYYLAFSLAKQGVNQFYKARYGVDFGLNYKTPDNHYNPVYGSVSYPRIDLLRPKDFAVMRRKLHIPDEVAAPNEAVKHQLPNILSSAWLDRMVLSNVFAAILTGYVTRMASMKGLPYALKSLGPVLKQPKLAAGLLSLATVRALLPKGTHLPTRRLVMALGTGTPLVALVHAMRAQVPQAYEAPGSGLPQGGASPDAGRDSGVAAPRSRAVPLQAKGQPFMAFGQATGLPMGGVS